MNLSGSDSLPPLDFSEYRRTTGFWCPRHVKDLPYAEFLKSWYWRRVANAVRRRARYRCELCTGQDGLQVHHKTYRNHGHEHSHLDDLICLCGACHAKFHDKVIDPSMEIEPVLPLDPFPKSSALRRLWIKRFLKSYIAPAVIKQLHMYEQEAGCSVEYQARVKTRLVVDLGLSKGAVTAAIWELHDQGKITSCGADQIRLFGGIR